MIRDKIENLSKYAFIHPNMDLVVEFLKNIHSKEIGKHEICDGIFVNYMEFDTKADDDFVYEYHKKYIDIQCVISGQECMYFNTLENLEVKKEFDVENDYGFYNRTKQDYKEKSMINAGEFVVYFAGEAHCPSCSFNGVHKVRKAVVKVRVN